MDKRYRVFFVVPPQVHLLDVSGPIHVFYEARAYGAHLDLIFLSLSEEAEHPSSAGLSLSKLEAYSDFELTESDILFIPGLEANLIFKEPYQETLKPFYLWLNSQHEKGASICSVCTGAYLLAYSGLFDGKECTTHWKYMTDFKQRFPKAMVHDDRLIVKDDRVYSSAGVASGIDLALFVLEELYDPHFAAQIAKEIVIFLRRTDHDPQLSVFLKYRNHIENAVHTVQDELAQNLSQKHTIEALADKVHMSPRNLTRRFKKATGITIGVYQDQLRVERAWQLLKDGQKVEVASQACGVSSNQLRSLLKKYRELQP